MKIKQAKYDYTGAENLKIYNYIPKFEKIKKELGVYLRLIAEPSKDGKEINLFAHFDDKNQSEAIVKILKRLSNISGTPLIIDFEETEENKEMVVTIYDDYIE